MTNTVDENIKYYEDKINGYMNIYSANADFEIQRKQSIKCYQKSLSKWQQFKKDLENKKDNTPCVFEKHVYKQHARNELINEIIGVGENE